jgi:hypothetical protein
VLARLIIAPQPERTNLAPRSSRPHAGLFSGARSDATVRRPQEAARTIAGAQSRFRQLQDHVALVWPRSRYGQEVLLFKGSKVWAISYFEDVNRRPNRLATPVRHRREQNRSGNSAVFASGFPGNSTEIRLLLTPHQAEDLARQLLLEAKRAERSRMAEAVPIATDCVRRVSIFLWLPRRCLCRIAVHAELFPTRCTHRGRRDIAPRTFRRRCNRKSSHAVSKRKGPFDGFEV